jgi:hypothetical protein
MAAIYLPLAGSQYRRQAIHPLLAIRKYYEDCKMNQPARMVYPALIRIKR